MSLSRIAQRISLPALLAVVLAAVLLAIAPGRRHLSLISKPSVVTSVILQAVQATGWPASRER